jgi:predicted AAA+ superfamily ATPase
MIAINTVTYYNNLRLNLTHKIERKPVAHERKRHISDVFDQLLNFSPIIGLFGHRQVGKSTFLANTIQNYRTLDDVEELEAAHSDPKGYIQSRTTLPNRASGKANFKSTQYQSVVIDECQLEPKLFPSLKEWVRTRKQPGQFVLSGSVRFTSRQAIKESLAGRMAIMELLPLTVSELCSQPLSDTIVKLFYHKAFSQDSLRCLHSATLRRELAKHFKLYLENGGLPGLCFIRNVQLQKNALNDLHNLILSRDLPLISELRTPITTLKRMLTLIAKNGFDPYIAADIKRTLGLAPQTQKKILDAMESTFLIRRIPVPLRKKEIILLEDQLEELVYAGSSFEINKRIETAVYRNIRTQFLYRLEKNVSFTSYLTRDHARVPIVVSDGEQTNGIIVIASTKPSLSERRSATSFLSSTRNAKILFLSAELIQETIIDERQMLCSIASIL